VLAGGTVAELTRDAGAETVITVRYEGGDAAELAGRTGLSARPGISRVETDDGRVRVFTREPDGVLGELVAAGTAAGLAVREATQLRPSLETVFLTLTGREYRG
jgi:ABC-2 type transport system ATP-binding protein